MTWMDRISLFTMLDFAALAVVVFLWLGIDWLIENSSAKRPSVSEIMARYRREWMQQMITRDPRIFDAQTVANLRQGTSLLASTSVIAIGGTLALIGNTETLAGLAQDLTMEAHPEIVWEIKLIVLVLFLTNAFLKFIWSNRLFGYCSVLMAAMPNDPSDPKASEMARRAAEINITAARSFNRGLRVLYFALSTVAWIAGPLAFMTAGIVTVVIIWRREFASMSRKILLDNT